MSRNETMLRPLVLLRRHAAVIKARHKDNPAAFWRCCLFWSFWISVALFPIGYGFREVMPPLCGIFLLLYYRHGWRDSVLARLGGPVLFFVCAAAMTLSGIIFSTNVWASLIHAGMGVNKAYILPFIAMECAHDLRDLRRLCWAAMLACFWQGLDGIYQALTGYDFIMGYGHKGRLTGSLGDYTVGNYLALALPPAFGVWQLLRRKLAASTCGLLCFALFWPPAFLFVGASSRSAVLAIGAALALWALMRHGRSRWLWLLLPCAAVGLFLLFEGRRFSPEAIINDNRWDLWRLGWRVFEAHPWFGAGAGQYNAAFRALGLAPTHEVITISHPHNVYLDMLYAHGIVGASLGYIFIFGFLWWGGKNIAPRLRRFSPGADDDCYWSLAAWFWIGYAAWLVNGIFGHDFYRIWWLALAMSNLGIAIGAIVKGRDMGERPSGA